MQNKQPKKSYYSRFQVKPRRRREGKTDYAKRRKLLRTDSNKPSSHKARLVVRITNAKVICQIFKPYVQGDKLLAYADSTELAKYGINFGLTNYSACYATGLLCGKRVLENVNLQSEGNTEPGTFYIAEDDEDAKVFQVVLDIGMRRATNGARVFAAMKGVSDAGVRVPHSPTKFYGEGEESESEGLRDRIFGKSVVEYMQKLREDDVEKYKKQFGKYISLGIEPEKISSIYKEAFEKIRSDWKKEIKKKDFDYSQFKRYKKQKMTKEERKNANAEKLKLIKG
ncbi:60S ribosomal protein L5 [Binucleata daphniae]